MGLHLPGFKFPGSFVWEVQKPSACHEMMNYFCLTLRIDVLGQGVAIQRSAVENIGWVLKESLDLLPVFYMKSSSLFFELGFSHSG